MTGWDDINSLKDQLQAHPLLGDPSKVLLLACHGSMPSSEQVNTLTYLAYLIHMVGTGINLCTLGRCKDVFQYIEFNSFVPLSSKLGDIF